MSHMATTETNPEKLLQSRVQDLKSYSDTQLKKLLSEHGLDKMPLTANTKNVILKKLAQIMLNLESASSDPPDLVPVEPVTNDISYETSDICKTLIEARDSLSSCLSGSRKTYYVIFIPGLSDSITILSDFRDVSKLMKEHKHQNPRMRSFASLADAEEFAKTHTANEVCQGTVKSHYPEEKAEVELTEVKLFPSLMTPQLNEFRIFLEKGNISAALERILANPRYLVQSIDMPTILKEGPRYNALHASVVANQLESCRLVMAMISDIEYLKCLYETQKRAEENSKRLIDLYLNTPDKVANKTPLHLASERGYADIVAFLVGFKACDRNFNPLNKETVKKVACSRYRGPDAAQMKTRIVELIEGGTCYVPLIRSDISGPYAKVGDPYTPTSPYKLVSELEDVLKPGTASPDRGTKDFRNIKIWAFAGPMSPKEAEDFKREWKSPRITRQSLRENFKVMDSDRGFERFGRELADSHSTSWQEYWPFLDAFADLRSEEGLDKLEQFFQKQQIINLMQALLRKEIFVTAQPYQVSQEYILAQDMLDSEGSEDENEMYFSADNLSSDEDMLDSTESSMLESEKEENSSVVKPSGFFSSIWNGIKKLTAYIPGFGKGKQNDTNVTNTLVTDTGRGSSKHSLTSGSDKSKCLSNNDQVDSVPSIKTTPPKRSLTQKESYTSSPSPSKMPKYAESKAQRRSRATKNGSGLPRSGRHDQSNNEEDSDLSITEPEENQTPDKWKYRTRAQSIDSESSSLGSPASPGDYIIPHTPVRQENIASTSHINPPEAQLDDSFNTKMDTFSKSLQKFSILSPTTSSSSSPSTSKLYTEMKPCIHIFTGKLFSKLLSELKSRKLMDKGRISLEDKTRLPTLFLRQDDGKMVLADCFLPGLHGSGDLLSQLRGQILDEYTHKEAIKNVWVNFLVLFSTPAEAKRITGLSQDEVVCAVIEGVPEDKNVYNIGSFSKVGQGSLKELYINSRDSLIESKHSITIYVRIVRSSTIPSKDVFVCGAIPTKVDADVYHTLNTRASQMIRKQPIRFFHVSRWYDKMTNQGNDSINSLPSPSRILRSERRELPPVSPLVSASLPSQAQQALPDGSSSWTAGEQNEPFVRNLFGHF